MFKRLLTHLWIVLLVISTGLAPVLTHANPTPLPSTLWVANKSITPEPSLIKDQNTIYIPINTLKKITPLSIKFSRKDNRYTLTQKKTNLKLIVIPYSREVIVNTQQFFFASPPVFFENSLYLPLDTTLSMLGLSATPSQNGYIISKNDLPFANQIISTQPHPNTLIATSGTEKIMTLDDHKLPILSTKAPLYLSFGSKIYDISDQFFYKDAILFINLKPILESESITLSETLTEYTLQKGLKTIRFSKQSPSVTIQDGTTTSQMQIEHPLIPKNDQLYFPLKSTLNTLDLASNWNSWKRIIEVLNKIKQINIIQDKEFHPEVQVITSYPIEKPTIQPLKGTNGYTIQIPDTQSVILNNLTKAIASVQSIKTSTTKKNITYIEFETSPTATYPNINLTPYGFSITFHKSVNQIIQTQNTLLIKGKGALNYTLTTDKAGTKIIVDIPDTLAKIPMVIRTEAPVLYSQIRTSQFSHAPLTTRIVVDIEPNVTVDTHTLTGDTIEIKLKSPILKAQTIAKPTAKTKPLHSKIIVIDAGHGGRDPGAILSRNIFEKDYTLDIAKRVEKKLTQKGAYVIMTRTEDVNTNLSTRTEISNQNNADIMVSIHFNSIDKPHIKGTETYYYKPQDHALALHLHKTLTKTLKTFDNGLKKNQFYVLNHSEMPATLLEPLYMTNPDDFSQLEKNSFREKLATAIADGITTYFKTR